MYTLKYYIHHLHYEHPYPLLHNTFWFPWINISILNMYTYVYIDEIIFLYSYKLFYDVLFYYIDVSYKIFCGSLSWLFY